MNLRRTWSKPGLVLGLVMMSLGAAAFTEPALPVPPGVQAESTWSHYRRTIQSDQWTVTQNRNRHHQTPSRGSPGSPRTRDHRAPMPGWAEVVLTGLFIVLIAWMVLTAKRRRQEKVNARVEILRLRLGWILSGLTSVALLGAGAPVFAASGYAANGLLTAKQNPAAGLPAMTKWLFDDNAYSPGIVFVFGTRSEAFPLNAKAPSVAKTWGGWDNPAALIWYYQHVSKTDFGNSVFGNGVKYSTRLIEVMKQEHFAPGMVGGVNPPNWNPVVAPKTKVAPAPPPPKNNPNEYPKGTTVLNWRWAPSAKRGTINIPAKPHHAVFAFSFSEPNGDGYPVTAFPTFRGAWVQFPKAWMRVDSVAVLKVVAGHAPKVFAQMGLAPNHLGLHYGADLAAAMTIQDFNPASLGMQPLAPSPKALTPATETWLIQHGWGGVLAQYATKHHVTLPHSTKKASKAQHS